MVGVDEHSWRDAMSVLPEAALKYVGVESEIEIAIPGTGGF